MTEPGQVHNGLANAGIVHALDPAVLLGIQEIPSPNPRAGGYFGRGSPYGLSAEQDTMLIGDSGIAILVDGNPRSPDFCRVVSELRHPNSASGGKLSVPVLLKSGLALVANPWERAGTVYGGSVFAFDGDRLSSDFGSFLGRFDNPRPPLDPKLSHIAFGFGLELVAGRLLVGAHADRTLADDCGAVHVFDANPASSTFGAAIALIENPHPGPGSRFGWQIEDVGSGEVAISAMTDSKHGPKAGAVYIYDVANPTTPREEVANPGGPRDRFGDALASAGAFLAVASPQSAGGGAVHIFERI